MRVTRMRWVGETRMDNEEEEDGLGSQSCAA